jgi:hypothetical protein
MLQLRLRFGSLIFEEEQLALVIKRHHVIVIVIEGAGVVYAIRPGTRRLKEEVALDLEVIVQGLIWLGFSLVRHHLVVSLNGVLKLYLRSTLADWAQLLPSPWKGIRTCSFDLRYLVFFEDLAVSISFDELLFVS